MKSTFLSYTLFIITALFFVVACSESDSSFSNSSESGQGGSMARFTITGDYLYTVDNSNLKTFSISTPDKPEYLQGKEKALGFGIETIFAMDTLLFIGSQDGMYIYTIKQAGFPQQKSFVSHIRSCDPVVASGNYAYVTLNSQNTWCGRVSNVLQVYNISNPSKPEMVKEERDFISPHGLGVDNNKLFICDNGLKVYDITDPENPIWIDDLTGIPQAKNMDAYDVIPNDGILLLTGKDGFYQFDYTGERLAFISKIAVSNR